MRRVALIGVLMLLSTACSPEEPVQDGAVPPAESGEAMEAAQQYELRGIVTARDGASLTIDHEAIGDWMGAMTMSFPVRGVAEADLPEVGESITATVNVEGTEYWLTDVQSAQAAPAVEGETSMDEMMGEMPHDDEMMDDQAMPGEHGMMDSSGADDTDPDDQ